MESPFMVAIIEAEVEAYCHKRKIMVEGRDVPKPVRGFRGMHKPITMSLHPPTHCLRQGKGGREGGREREKKKKKKKKKKKRRRGPPEALPSHGSQTDSCISVRAQQRARQLAVPEPWALAPTGTKEAFGEVWPASRWPAMPLPQRGGGRKKKHGKEKKREERRKKKEERKKRKRKEKE